MQMYNLLVVQICMLTMLLLGVSSPRSPVQLQSMNAINIGSKPALLHSAAYPWYSTFFDRTAWRQLIAPVRT